MVTRAARDRRGRFEGVRYDLESVPRGRPYLVFWVARDGSLAYHLRLRQTQQPDFVALDDPVGRGLKLRVERRSLPRRGGVALLYRCPSCWTPRRYLYGLVLIGGEIKSDGFWRCQQCAGLRFASQGRYQKTFERQMMAAIAAEYGVSHYREPLPRHPWDPRAVSDPRMVVDEFPGQLVQRVPH
jgi:hypothetical protein